MDILWMLNLAFEKLDVQAHFSIGELKPALVRDATSFTLGMPHRHRGPVRLLVPRRAEAAE